MLKKSDMLSREVVKNINQELAQIYQQTLQIFNIRLINLDPKVFKLLQQSGARNDFIQFAEQCMQIIRKIFTICNRPIGFFVEYSSADLPKEIYALKTIMSMNNYAIAMMREQQFPFNQKIMLDYLRESYMSHQEIKKMDQYIQHDQTFEAA
jgi:hypothetical protein